MPLIPGFGSFAQAYQSYLTSHARTGDPNTFKKTVNLPPAITWPKPGTAGDKFSGVLDAGDLGFRLIEDGQTARGRCGFWVQVAAAVTGLGGEFFLSVGCCELWLIALGIGYAPPGSAVPTTLVPVRNDPSANYGS